MRNAIILSLILTAPAFADDHTQKMPPRKAVLLDGLGNIHHPVSTKNAEAQKFFDQGLRLIYAFNHDEALLAFERAAELDPKLAMAYWGMALAVGPNYNLDAEAAALKAAYASIQKAQTLAKNAPEHERAYVDALAQRYSSDPKADKKQRARAYAAGMKVLHEKYPDDLDAATLYAESLMNLHPWELWSQAGKANENTHEILRVLDGVLARNPDHTGANHYYIHAIEASPQPECGLSAADRLRGLNLKAGHLVHMPSHIYARVGDHAAAARANEEAAAVDRAYIEKFKIHGVYPMMYYSHNLHFLAVSHAMQGRFGDAKKAGDQLAAHVEPHIKDMPMLEFFLPTSTLILVRFQRWNDVLALPQPDAKLRISRALWHFACGSALARMGKDAQAEVQAFEKVVKEIPQDLGYGDRNKARDVLFVAEAMLKARVELARNEPKRAIELLELGLVAEEKLNYIEPEDWYLPCRELLGAVLYREKRFGDAEKIFRADLARNRRNPRALFGLMECLSAQGKTFAAQLVAQEYQAAWRNADVKLSLDAY